MSIESVVALVRSLWNRVEEARESESEQVPFKRDIARTINRLKDRVEKKLKGSTPAREERLLFDGFEERPAPIIAEEVRPPGPGFPKAPLAPSWTCWPNASRPIPPAPSCSPGTSSAS